MFPFSWRVLLFACVQSVPLSFDQHMVKSCMGYAWISGTESPAHASIWDITCDMHICFIQKLGCLFEERGRIAASHRKAYARHDFVPAHADGIEQRSQLPLRGPCYKER